MNKVVNKHEREEFARKKFNWNKERDKKINFVCSFYHHIFFVCFHNFSFAEILKYKDIEKGCCFMARN